MISVKKIMTKNVLNVDGETNVRDVSLKMKTEKVGSLLVMDNDEVLGIVTEADIIQKVIAMDLNPYVTKAKAIMSSPLITIDVSKTIIEANDIMDQKHVRHLAVLEEDEIVGILSVRDLLHPLYYEGETW